jgi:CheY-like chemotaxis protein
MGRLELTFARALIVDDNEDYAAAIAALLRLAFCCEVTTCTNALEVLEAVKASRPHLLLLDLTMEPIDGFEVIEQLKTHSVLPPLTVAVSGYTSAAITAKCLAAGFHSHVFKPVSPDRLGELLHEAVERTSKCASPHC